MGEFFCYIEIMSQCQQARIFLNDLKTRKEQLSQVANSLYLVAREERNQLYNSLTIKRRELNATIEQLENLTTLEIERFLNLKEQYHQRVTTLLKLGLVTKITVGAISLSVLGSHFAVSGGFERISSEKIKGHFS